MNIFTKVEKFPLFHCSFYCMVFREEWLHLYALRILFSVVVLISKQILVILKDGKAFYFLIPMLKSNLKINNSKSTFSHCNY